MTSRRLCRKTPKGPFAPRLTVRQQNINGSKGVKVENKAGSTLQSITGTTSPDPQSGRKELLLKPETGFTAIVFALLKLLREVGGRVRELSLDSACKVFGSGMPLGYRFVQSTPGVDAGGTDRFFRQLLSHFKTFDQDTYVAPKFIPHLTVRFQGAPVQPALTLRVNGTVQTVIPHGVDSHPAPIESGVEDGDLLDEVDFFLGKNSITEQDAEDGPDWTFDEGGKKSADPSYILSDGHCIGHSKAPTHFQQQFNLPSASTHITRVDQFTCTCKSRKFNSCHLCKHLVAVGTPPAKLWMEISTHSACGPYEYNSKSPSHSWYLGDNEERLDAHAEHLQKWADDRNRLWMSSIVGRNIGKDDTGRVRDITWAQNEDRKGRRRIQNTMGYQIPLASD
ncbi:hypothetical protein DFH09DRAFT_1101549 [Mycena vulgaris]|nr:hypothetical protein DFH09DRAFT_1101549 [Mycena vulgaris]